MFPFIKCAIYAFGEYVRYVPSTACNICQMCLLLVLAKWDFKVNVKKIRLLYAATAKIWEIPHLPKLSECAICIMCLLKKFAFYVNVKKNILGACEK